MPRQDEGTSDQEVRITEENDKKMRAIWRLQLTSAFVSAQLNPGTAASFPDDGTLASRSQLLIRSSIYLADRVLDELENPKLDYSKKEWKT